MPTTVMNVLVHKFNSDIVWTLPSSLPGRVIKVLEDTTGKLEAIYVEKRREKGEN